MGNGSENMDIEQVIVLENRPDAIVQLTQAVETFGDAAALPPKLVFRLTLALEEIVTNVVSYGYQPGSKGRIEVTLRRQGDEAQAEVVDDGVQFDPLSEAPTPDLDASVEERRIGGLGLHFVKTLMEHIEYRWQDGRNHLKLRQRISDKDDGHQDR